MFLNYVVPIFSLLIAMDVCFSYYVWTMHVAPLKEKLPRAYAEIKRHRELLEAIVERLDRLEEEGLNK